MRTVVVCNQFDMKGSSQCAFLRTLLPYALTVTLVTSGCAVNGNSMADFSTSEELVTSSVATNAKPEGILETDAKVIKDAVVSADTTFLPLTWSNKETGSTGTITSIDSFKGNHGQLCRGFKTSVDNFKGIAYYNGETCHVKDENWVLSWFKAAD